MIIDDNNYRNHLNPIVSGQRKLTGYEGMWEDGAYASGTFDDLDSVPLIPESEWDDRIRQAERDGTTQRQFALDMGLPCKDQDGTSFCWINGPTYCAEFIRLQEMGRVVNYSPASAGARIKNFRNVGGWGSQALDWMRENGINYVDDWPANAINRRYNTDENQEKAKAHQVVEYYKISGWDEMVSCLLCGIPCGVGFNWWRHLVAATGVTIGEHNLEIRNSWGMGWGEQGFGILKGRRKYPDGIVAIVSMLPM